MPRKIIPSYEEAQKIVQGRVKNRNEYYAFRLKHPEYNLPNSPRASYRKEYETMHEFLGVPKYDQKKCLEQYWIDVKAGKRTRKYSYDIKVPITVPVPSFEEAKKILTAMQGDKAFIFNLGHGVLPATPVSNVQALIDLVKSAR